MSSADHAPIRSYQRIFRPERRIYQVEGHRLPVPGGVPLRWLAYAIGALLAILLLGQRSVAVAVLVASGATIAALAVGGRTTAMLVGAATLGATQVVGVVVTTLDWPLRLLVLPALVATLATQATPDGRSAHRYVASWLSLQVRPPRRSLARELPELGERRTCGGPLWVRPDEHRPELVACRLRGPAAVEFGERMTVVRGRFRPRRLMAERSPRRARELRAVRTDRVELGADEVMEVQP